MPNHSPRHSSDKFLGLADKATKEAIENRLGKQLRTFFGPVEDQPLPENLRRLVERLECALKEPDGAESQ